MSWRNKPNENFNGNAFEKFFNNNKKKEKTIENNKKEIKKKLKPLAIQIKEIDDILNSGKYMSKIKRNSLEEKLEKLKKDKENEFPDLVQPTVFNNTQQRSIWLKPLIKLNQMKVWMN